MSENLSSHQASEWGMSGLQSSFPRCKKRLHETDQNKENSIEIPWQIVV
jgi:hypothetical protein